MFRMINERVWRLAGYCSYSWRGIIVDTDGGIVGFGSPIPGAPGVSSEGGSLTPDAFNQIITDASSFSLTINSGTRNAIQWIASKDRILIGTTGGEWSLSGHGTDKPITPTSFSIKPHTVRGSKDMQPLVVDEAVLFVDYVGKKLRELVYVADVKERYISPDLMLLADHITESGGITSMAYQKTPDSIIWATLANGDLISCTYEKEQDVVAWARHPISLGDVVGDEVPSTTSYTPAISTQYPLLRTTTDQDDPQLPHVTAISNVEELQAMNNNKAGNYYLTNDIDASDTLTWNSGVGFTRIGDGTTAFTGTFDGCGYTISNLYIYRIGNVTYTGMFGKVSSPAKIANVTLTDVDITANNATGALVGWADGSATTGVLIQNCHASGIIKSGFVTPLKHGGLVGWSRGTAADKYVNIYDCSSSVNINNVTGGYATQGSSFGGFAGEVVYSDISNCFATGSITSVDSGQQYGGFAGDLNGISSIEYCYATGDVQGEDNVGGFAGKMTGVSEGYIRKSYSTGNVTSDGAASNTSHGGFIGYVTSAEITDCYAWGNIIMLGGGSGTAGFAADFIGAANTISNCYSIGLLTSSGTNVGGFNGTGNAGISNCFWDTETSGTEDSADGTGKTTTLMKTESTFTDWDFDTIWTMSGGGVWVDIDNSNSMGCNSVCVIPGSTEDEVWVTVSRAINGLFARYIERMKPRYWGRDQEDCFFVDSGLTYDGDATDTFAGLGHLEGEEVAILGDGAVFPTQVVTNAALPEALSETVSVCHIGLPYTYKWKPMRLDQASAKGTTKGSIKKIAEVVISFFRTLNARYSDGTTERGIDFRKTEAYTTPPSLFTGDKVVVADGGFDVEDGFEITGSDPLPCTVRAIVPRLDQTGR
jgi:hypothetical protein